MTDQHQRPAFAGLIEQMAHAARRHAERHQADTTVLTAWQTAEHQQQPQEDQSITDTPNTQVNPR